MPGDSDTLGVAIGFGALGHNQVMHGNGVGLPPGWERIAEDLGRTTGRSLVLRPSETEDFIVEILLDERFLGAVGCGWDPSQPEDGVAVLADLLREHSLDEEIWGGWPICPGHHHPMDTSLNDGDAVWICPEAGAVVALIGQLGI